MARAIVCAALVLCLIGCSGKKPEKGAGRALSERQRDSVISESKLPGASVVKGAISASDSAAARAKRIDSQTK
jgi:hypothetical protein